VLISSCRTAVELWVMPPWNCGATLRHISKCGRATLWIFKTLQFMIVLSNISHLLFCMSYAQSKVSGCSLLWISQWWFSCRGWKRLVVLPLPSSVHILVHLQLSPDQMNRCIVMALGWIRTTSHFKNYLDYVPKIILSLTLHSLQKPLTKESKIKLEQRTGKLLALLQTYFP